MSFERTHLIWTTLLPLAKEDFLLKQSYIEQHQIQMKENWCDLVLPITYSHHISSSCGHGALIPSLKGGIWTKPNLTKPTW